MALCTSSELALTGVICVRDLSCLSLMECDGSSEFLLVKVFFHHKCIC